MIFWLFLMVMVLDRVVLLDLVVVGLFGCVLGVSFVLCFGSDDEVLVIDLLDVFYLLVVDIVDLFIVFRIGGVMRMLMRKVVVILLLVS